MSVCPENNRLSAYHDGELDAPARVAVEAHLTQCPACAEELAEMAAMSNLFATAQRPHLSQIAAHRLSNRVRELFSDDVLRIARRLRAIAACVLVVCSIWLLRSSNSNSRQSLTEASPSTPPWIDVAVAASAETNSLDATTPAAAWYVADFSSRGDAP
jgi:anti-sigma factor RsiW